MASNVLLAKGSKLYRKNPTSSVYEEVVQCVTLAVPSISQEWIDITNHSSSGGYRERVPGLKDVANISVDIFWNPASIAMHATIYADAILETPLVRRWGILLPNALTGWNFDAYLGAPSGTLNIDRAVQITFGLQVTGQPTYVSTGTVGFN